MSMYGRGALPSQTLRKLIEQGALQADVSRVNPASLDLAPTAKMYRVAGTFLPRQGERIEDMLCLMRSEPHDPCAAMEQGVTYLMQLGESGSLPSDVYGYGNPKSSTGRDGPHVRLLADGVESYDSLPRGWSGTLWASVVPKIGAIRIPPGEPLCQVRFFTKDTRFSERNLETELRRNPLVWSKCGTSIGYKDLIKRDHDGSVMLTLDLSRRYAGWEWLGNGEVLDFGKRKHYDPLSMWRRVHVKNGMVRLRHGGFYILSTAEYVRVPPYLACEMAPMDERLGEFRSHRAGFIDPGWGYGEAGEIKGRPITLEVEPFENLVLRDRQIIARIKFERMAKASDMPYYRASSNYANQIEARLSKRWRI